MNREDLKAAYLYVVENWAVYSDEVAVALHKAGASETATTPYATKLLKKLSRVGLLASERINGEKAVTWQSHYDVQNGDDPADAERDFDEAFPVKAEVASTGRKGATGARYTEAQLDEAAKLHGDGVTWKAIGAKLGIKATGHLAKTVKARIESCRHDWAASKRTPAGRRCRKCGRHEAATKRTVKGAGQRKGQAPHGAKPVDAEAGLTKAQARYLAEIRAAGEKRYNGRARKPLTALVEAGLITTEYDLQGVGGTRLPTELFIARPVG